jgi:hypothetical protein
LQDLATIIGEEVDFVIGAGNKLLSIEVKATASPRLAVPWWRVLRPWRYTSSCRCGGAMNGFAACQGRSC